MGGESRLVYGKTWESVKAGVGKGVNLVKKSPLMRVISAGYGAAKTGYDVGRLGYHTGKEGVKGVFGCTGRPFFTWMLAVAKDLKMNLIDIPLTIAGSLWRIPIAIAKSPAELINGVRQGMRSIPKNLNELGQSIWDVRVFDMMRSSRNLVMDALVPPIQKPLEGILEDPAKVASLATRSKLQYVLGIKRSIQQARDGVNHVIHVRDFGRASMMAADAKAAGKLAEKKKAEEAVVKQKGSSRGMGSAAGLQATGT